ncbi:hypothetical protein AB6N01_01195 [Alcaligenes nematophilus]|uniref:hypothetical protein n=1 Tax=Alcaligenes nematophilus TaxID=2994643 RepID=UPI0034E0B1C0
MYQRRLIVQDAESHLFLKPYEGDIGLTPLLVEAGGFCSREDAIETASSIFEKFFIFEYFLSDANDD